MSRQEDFHQFLDAMALGADGSSRKTASPSLLSPLPAGPPPTGETMFKKKNRHTKTSSQPIRVDTNELRDEYAKAAAQPRQASEDDRRESMHESDKSMKSQSAEETEDGKKKSGVAMSFTRRFPKMSLVRGMSGASTSSTSSSPRPRSPSKESTVGGLMRMGNRSAIVSKLGLGKHVRRESEEKAGADSEDTASNAASPPYFTPATALPQNFNTVVVGQPLQLPPTAPQLGYSVSVPAAAVGGFRRSSAPNNNLGPEEPLPEEADAEDARRRDRRLSGTKGDRARPAAVEVPKERAPYATNDKSPVLLQEKNPSTSLLQSSSDPNSAAAARSEQELARWREDHAILESNMARNVKGALLLAKTAGTPKKRGSGGMDNTSHDEALRVAALTLQANNDQRLRELTRKIAAFEEKAVTISNHANRIREDLLTECRQLVDHADKLDASLVADRETFSKKEISYRTANTKSESELRSLNEKISNILVLKEKGFRDMISDAETRLKKLTNGNGGNEEHGWFVSILDHGAHAMMELILLGGGTLLSLIFSIVMAIRSFIPCLRGRTAPVKTRRSSNGQGRSRPATTT